MCVCDTCVWEWENDKNNTSIQKEIKGLSCPLGEHLELVMGRCIKGRSAFLEGCPCPLEVEVQVSGAC